LPVLVLTRGSFYSHQEVRKRLSRFLLGYSKQKWLQGAYRVLTALDISIENHAKQIGTPGYWANFFDAFVCGLFLRLDITMVTAGQNPVNLRDEVNRLSDVKWPAIFDASVQPRFIGYVNYSNVNRTSLQNHFVKLARVNGQ